MNQDFHCQQHNNQSQPQSQQPQLQPQSQQPQLQPQQQQQQSLQPVLPPYDINALLMDDPFSADLISTPQLYYSPSLHEESIYVPQHQDQHHQQQQWLNNSSMSHQWFDPPVGNILEEQEQRKETPLDEKKYVCPICHHRSKRRHNMVEHMQTHDPNRPKLFSCGICQRPFARKYDMKRHEKIHLKK
ncbi:hypothetical protein RMCBS344292_00507 [Rhizopus microsporus]|nr:hypothetical protein RMCBS344292_00507 [Rhizopus microsporus]